MLSSGVVRKEEETDDVERSAATAAVFESFRRFVDDELEVTAAAESITRRAARVLTGELIKNLTCQRDDAKI